MKRKFFVKAALILSALMCMFGLFACGGRADNGGTSDTHKHSYVTTVVEPTCSEQGYTLHKCECGNEYKDKYKPMTFVHTPFPEAVIENAVEATCDHGGSYDEVTYCIVCKAAINTEHKIVPKLEHSFVNGSCISCGQTLEDTSGFAADGFTIDREAHKVSLTVSSGTQNIDLVRAFRLNSGCTWELYEDFIGAHKYALKAMSLDFGHNVAYIIVYYDADNDYFTRYELDIYRLSLYTYSFVDKWGKTFATETIEENTEIEAPTDTARPYYDFLYWTYIDYIPAEFPFVIKSDVIFTAAYSPVEYEITYALNGGTHSTELPDSYDVETPEILLTAPTRDYYDFGGWYDNAAFNGEAKTSIPMGSHGDKQYYAQWTPIDYEITLHFNDGTPISDIAATYNVETETITIGIPTRDYYDFGGWYDNETFGGDAVTTIPKGSHGDKEYYAKWTPTVYGITYYLNGGAHSTALPTSYNVETNTIALTDPTRDYYDFKGWYDNAAFNGEAITSIPMGSHGDRQYYAKWTPIDYEITYDLNGGTHGADSVTSYNVETAVTLDVPTRDGYDFKGWYDNAAFDGNAVTGMPKGSHGDRHYYAKWTIAEYSITYNLNGGILDTELSTSYNMFTATISFVDPTRDYYDFGGWYDNATFNGEAVTSIPQGSYGNKEYYAKWMPIEYTITYVLNGGAFNSPAPTSYNIESDDIELLHPTATENEQFDGWFTDSAFKNNIGVIHTGSYGNVIVYAKWSFIFEYSLKNDNTCTVVKYNGTSANVTIPQSYNGKPVTSIGGSAFSGCSRLTSVTIGNGVTSIGESAFSGCSGLTSITLPFVGGSATATAASNSTLFGYIFGTISYTGGMGVKQYYSSGSYSTYYIPTSLTNVTITGGNILYGAFRGCSSLTSVTIPNSVTSIESYAFYNCSNLTSITIPDSVMRIGWYAFYGCSSLTSVTIGNSVTSIGEYAFYECSGLTGVTYTGDIKGWCKMSGLNNLMWYGASTKSLTIDGNEITGALVIPNGVTTIPSYAFSGCSGLTSITIPDSVTSIGDDAFRGCSGLTSITIPDSVTSIGSEVFSGCSSLESITLPFVGGSATATTASSSTLFGYIFGTSGYTGGTETKQYNPSGSYSIYYIPTSLKNVTIAGGNILYGAFRGCSSLTSVTIGNSVTSIGSSAFSGCRGLTSITIPDSVTSIGSSAFSGCSSLTSITIPDSVTSIGSSAFSGCSSLTSVTIGNSVTSIGGSAFSGCSSLTIYCEAESEPSGWSSSWNYSNCHVVWNCKNNNIDNDGYEYAVIDGIRYSLKDGVATVIRQATSISGAITIPSNVTYKNDIYNVTSIGDDAFRGCSGLTSITIPDSVTSIGSEVFSGCSSLESITLPFVGGSATAATESRSTLFGYIFGTSSYMGGTETEQRYSSGRDSTYYIPTSLKNVTITGGNILYGAFYNCSGLTSITIPDSVTSIGECAFHGCSSLTSITIPDSVTSMGKYAFFDCSSLETVYWNATACTSEWSYDYPIFYNCSKLATVIIGDNVTSIGDNAFYECSGLTSVTIGNSVTSIGSSAFSGCRGLTSITIPDSVTSIGSSAFFNCSGLASVTIGNSVTSIGSSAFSGCSGLASVTIPDSVTSIGSSAFSGCSSLTSITIPDSVTSIGGSAFSGCSGLTSMVLPFVGGSATATTASSSTLFGYIFGTSSYTGGMGVKQYYSSGSYSTYYIPTSLTNVTITGGNILYGAFRGCSSLTSITIPDSVMSIGWYAFSGCSSLTSVTIPNSVTSIGDDAFYNCSRLTSIEISNSVISIGSEAFRGCNRLKSIIIPNSVTRIGSYAFYGCSSLTIYCEAESKPSGWADYWNWSPACPVVWGYKGN